MRKKCEKSTQLLKHLGLTKASIHHCLTGCGETTWTDTRQLRRWIVGMLTTFFPPLKWLRLHWVGCAKYIFYLSFIHCVLKVRPMIQLHESKELKEESLTQPHHGLIKLSGWPQRCVWGHRTWFRWPHCCCWLTAVWRSVVAKFCWTFRRRFCGLAPHLCIKGKIPFGGIDAKLLLRKPRVNKNSALTSWLQGTVSCTTTSYCGDVTLLATRTLSRKQGCIVVYSWC